MTTQQSKQRTPEELIKHMQSTMEAMGKVANALNKREQRIAAREKEMGIVTNKTTVTPNVNDINFKTEVVNAEDVGSKVFAMQYDGYALMSNEQHHDDPSKRILKFAKAGGAR